MATKFIIRDQESKESDKVVKFWLKQDIEKRVCLMASQVDGISYTILLIEPGKVYAPMCVNKHMDLPVDDEGRIVISTK